MTTPPRREHDWDMLRALLMVLGIPYHASMAYNANVPWDIHSPETSALLTYLSGLLVTFRMPAFFIVAGYFAIMVLDRKPVGAWLANRYIRLGVPFITGLILLIPPQIELMHIADALSGRTTLEVALGEARNELTHPGPDWIMHLWFLPTLMVYCTMLAVAFITASHPVMTPVVSRLRRWLEIRRDVLFLVAIALLMVWELTLRAAFIEFNRLGPGLPAAAARGLDPYLRYLPYFVIGVLLRREPAVRHAFRMPNGWIIPAAAFLAASIASFTHYRGIEILELVNAFATGAAALLISRLLIGHAHHHWNRPDVRIDRIVDASFTIYLVHHPIIYALATAFLLVSWPPVIEFTVIATLTALLSYGFHRLIRRSSLALFLFNGIPPRRRNHRAVETGCTLR